MWIRKRARHPHPVCPVPIESRRNPDAWIALLERYIPRSLREGPVKAEPKDDLYQQGYGIAVLLSQARRLGDVELLGYLGFRLNRWSAVHALLSKLIDATEGLRQALVHRHPVSSFDWGAGGNVSLDELSSGAARKDGARGAGHVKMTRESPVDTRESLLTLSSRSLSDEMSQRLMAEVWASLGSIVLGAADLTPADSRLAMSYVFQILARLHHSGMVSDNVYRYSTPEPEQVAFRPPGMYLVSTYIMSSLSDAAWRVHEAEVAAKAAAAGQESPFLPLKMGFRELGPEIWFEFILWCCVDHGHCTEGAWLLERMKKRNGDQAWHIQSWKPLLDCMGIVEKTNISTEEYWRHSDSEPPVRWSRERDSFFHGLAKRTISFEVVASLLGGLIDNIYLGFGIRGLSSTEVRQYVSLLTPMVMMSGSDDKLQPTTKVANWLLLRNLESGGLNTELEPRAFGLLLRSTPHVVPPWDEGSPTDETDLEEMDKSELYDGTSALTGLIEHSVRLFALTYQTGTAFTSFAWLQEIVDSSKLQRIRSFLEKPSQPDRESLGFFDSGDAAPSDFYESSIPQMSNVTFARLLDLATSGRAFKFGRWLLYSDDVDGSPIPPSAFGDQALAPSILRFAAATKDAALCRQVIHSLSSPISVNTLRALMHVRIALGQWDQVVQILAYIRDHRMKSWSHSTVSALAAAVVEADGTITKGDANQQEATENKNAAQEILHMLFEGEFSDKYDRTQISFQQRVLHRLHRVFLTIPGPLQDFARKSKPLLSSPSISPLQVPIIPSPAFHILLSTLVRVQGSATGKNLWEQWCLELPSQAKQWLHEGGIPRLYSQANRDLESEEPQFDASWYRYIRERAIIPNLDTVRIIAQAALDEYNHERKVQRESPPKEDVGMAEPSDNAAARPEDVLEFCIEKFRALDLWEKDIRWELRGYRGRTRRDGTIREQKVSTASG